MMTITVFIQVIFILTGLLGTAYSECEESYVTFCDCVPDLLNYKSVNWTDVVIGSTKNSCSSARIDSVHFEPLEEIKLLFLVNQVDAIHPLTFRTIGQTLKVVKFYGNNLKYIASSTFAGFRKLSRLSLRNNRIQSIGGFAFNGSTIKNLDLSSNQLEVIPEDTFRGSEISIINLRNNKLSSNNDNTFNQHLQVVHFDYNNFETLPINGFGKNTPRLQELTISHNKLSHISDISILEKVRRLDFSFNNINFVRLADFEDLKDLVYLDLSSNKLETFTFKFFKKVKAERMTLLLSYNLLTNIKITDNVKPMTVTLFGNPWNCKCLENMERAMKGHNFTTTQCNFELFKNGHLPICIDQGVCKSSPVENKIDLKRFIKLIDKQKENLTCDIFREVGAKYICSF